MMKTHRQPLPPHRDESGQAALVVALFLFFVFLAFASLAIDGAAFYLGRRDLQSVADAAALAACTVLSQPQGDGVDPVLLAYATAENEIEENLGAWAPYVGDNPWTTNVGSGVGLLKGIEVSDPVVRVALQRPVPTVLTQFVGRTDTIVTAQARCDSRAGGGLLPIAVQHYDIDTYVDYLAKEGAPLYPSDSYTETIFHPTAEYEPFFDVRLPLPDHEASNSNPGPEVVLLGQAAETNNGESNMRNLVLLDIRNVASEYDVEYYNFDENDPQKVDAAKDMSQDWIYQHGYPGPYPKIGSQIAILDGASTNMAAGAMYQADYQVGDVVAAIVYDGYVWTTPDFDIALTPVSGVGITPGYPSDPGTAVEYTVSIFKPTGAPQAWPPGILFNLTFAFNNQPPPPGTQMTLDGYAVTPGVPYTQYGVTEAGWNGTLRIWSTEAITVGQYLSGINVIANASILGRTDGASSNFGFGAIAPNDYIVRSNDGRLFLHQGGSYSADLTTFTTGLSFPGSGPGCSAQVQAQVLVGGVLGTNWSLYFSSPQNDTVRIRRNRDTTRTFALAVQPNAPRRTDYTLRLTVDSPCSGIAIPSHSVDIPFAIDEPEPSSPHNKFVFIQGYAVFKITKYEPLGSGNPNTVYARAISKIYTRYEDITVGLRPRLVPWN